jgi:hypothetical protein
LKSLNEQPLRGAPRLVGGLRQRPSSSPCVRRLAQEDQPEGVVCLSILRRSTYRDYASLRVLFSVFSLIVEGRRLVLGERGPAHMAPAFSRFSYYNSLVEIHSSARKHGLADEDIRHAMDNAMSIDDQDDDTRLYLGPARSAEILEVVTLVREDGFELVIHAMKMRPKYRRLLPRD